VPGWGKWERDEEERDKRRGRGVERVDTAWPDL